jgi:hypothetical protein
METSASFEALSALLPYPTTRKNNCLILSRLRLDFGTNRLARFAV